MFAFIQLMLHAHKYIDKEYRHAFYEATMTYWHLRLSDETVYSGKHFKNRQYTQICIIQLESNVN